MAERVIYFISDLHLTDGTKAERFKYHAELMALLDRIEAEPGAELVIVGDWFEGWVADLGPIFASHADIITRILRLAGQHPVSYVVGNHDALPWYWYVGQSLGPVRVMERYTTQVGGRTLVALHGHQFDPFNHVRQDTGQVRLPAGRHMVYVLGMLERAGLGQLVSRIRDSADTLEPLANEVVALLRGSSRPGPGTVSPTATDAAVPTSASPAVPMPLLHFAHDVVARESPGQRGYPQNEDNYRQGARRMMAAGARYIVMGHTHHPEQVQMGRGQYVNIGSWVWERYGPTYARVGSGAELQLRSGITHQAPEWRS